MDKSNQVRDLTDADDTNRAEAILFGLAALLRSVPLSRSASRLHIRALELKRDVSRWSEVPASSALRQATIDDLLSLQREVQTASSLETWAERRRRQA